MTFRCYLPRSSEGVAIGAVFVTVGGVRRLLPDHWLTQVELSQQGRLLRFIYTGCTVEVAGQRLDVFFEDAIAGRLGTVIQAPLTPAVRDQPWVSSLVTIVPAVAVSVFERR